MKLVLAEEGSAAATRLWDEGEEAVSSAIAYPEARAAVAAARRGGRISRPLHAAILDELEDLGKELLLLDVDEQLARRAGDLAEEHALRGYDAVHLASALVLGNDVIVVTWDRDLAAAAERSGCATAGIAIA